MILVIWIIWQASGWSATEALLAKKSSNERKKEGGRKGRKDEIFLHLVSTISTQISLVGFYAREKFVSGLL